MFAVAVVVVGRESLDQVRDLGFHVMVTANAEGLLWTQHGAGLAATLGSEVVAVDRMDDDEVQFTYHFAQ